MTHSIDDDWDNREYKDPLSDPRAVDRALHEVTPGSFWDDPDEYFDEDEEYEWEDE